MRRQSYCANPSTIGGVGEPQIIVEESTVDEEEEERRNESPPRCVDPDSPSLNPYLLYPWKDNRKHSLPTLQCTSGITASQVRRLSERGGEGSGPSPREATYLATISQAPAPQPGGRRHSVVTISKVPPILFGRDRRESIAAFPLSRKSGLSGTSSNNGSTHNLQLDIMDGIARIRPKKVRMKMYKTPTEQVCEIQPLEGNSSTQRYTQNQKRRFSEIPVPSVPSTASLRRRVSELPKAVSVAGAAGIVCSNTDLISILNSLTSSATEINRCGEEASTSREEDKSSWSGESFEQKRNVLKSFRSNSFDVSILHGAKSKLPGSPKATGGSNMAPSNWFRKRHLPMSKKQKPEDLITASLNFKKFNKSKVIKMVKETLGRTSPNGDTKHRVVWDDTSGTKVDAQVLGNAIEKILTAQSGSGTSSKTSVSPNKSRAGKVPSWFPGSNKDQEQSESCEPSICSSFKDLFVK